MGRPKENLAGLLSRLARDVRANTLAIMAVAMIPLIGMLGGAIDLSRMYIVKTRLQHACDAGALAGRRAMGGGTWTQSSGYPGKAAQQFFKANISDTAYGASAVTGQFRENAGKVTGTATATMPMTLMRVFGFTAQSLSVTCDAEMRLPNTDVMFVLDVTGSMRDKAAPTDTETRMDGLRTAVKCFYEIVARLDTDAVCTSGNPSGGTGNQVQIRFGFMPYASNVNVGKLLPPSYFANNWTYQSRTPVWRTVSTTAWVQSGQRTDSITESIDFLRCLLGSLSGLGGTTDTITGNVRTVVTTTYASLNQRTCTATRVTVTTTYALVTTSNNVFETWRYEARSIPVSGLKNGSSWNSRYQLVVGDIGDQGSPRTITWNGCIEERPTVSQSSYTPIPSGAYDMNIDLVPTQGNPNSLWGPALKDVIYLRDVTTSWNQANNSKVPGYTNSQSNFYNSGYPYNLDDYCPTEARKLQSWPSAAAFSAYVDSLTPAGNTYHDVGITWGARFLSPTGIFASENAYTPAGGEIERHMIFMTDGDTSATVCDYASHGVAFYDQRTTSNVGTVANCPNRNAAVEAQVNSRFTALCTAVKNMNITLWVISFGSDSSSDTENRLKACASTDRYFTARNSAALQATFKSIADQISQLRLTR